jgi:hypothetical protein
MRPDDSEPISSLKKKCSKCNQIKKVIHFYKNSKNKDGYNYCCKHCHNEVTERWRERNHEKVLEQGRNFYKSHPESSIQSTNNWRKNNIDRFNQYERVRHKKLRGELNTTYVKRMICQRTSLKLADIPDSMVEAYRETVKIKRLIKLMES